jgi:predicted dehydrogenase
MTIWNRIRGIEDPLAPLSALVAGSGPEAERLAAALRAEPGVTVTAAAGEEALAAIRRREVALVEIALPAAEAKPLAEEALRAGLFVSTCCPPNRADLRGLADLADQNHATLRIRLNPFYYPPYREMKRLLDDDAVGRPVTLKMTVRRGKGTVLPAELSPAAWIAEHELGFLALAGWMVGTAEKAFGRLEPILTNGTPASSLLAWKFAGRHQYGYLQLDFCPKLHVRTFTEPVHRALELTGLGGIIFATRGEGQLLRSPALIVRGKSTTTAFEILPDDWREVYPALAREAIAAVRSSAPVLATADRALEALKILELAGG